MSIRRICSIAWVARCARPGSGSLSSSISSAGNDLPGDAELVLEPAALALLAALGQPVPVVVGLLLVLADDLEGDRLGERELRPAVEGGVLLAVEGEVDGQDVALLHRRGHVRPVAGDVADARVREDRGVVLRGLLRLAVEPETRDLLGHREFLSAGPERPVSRCRPCPGPETHRKGVRGPPRGCAVHARSAVVHAPCVHIVSGRSCRGWSARACGVARTPPGAPRPSSPPRRA